MQGFAIEGASVGPATNQGMAGEAALWDQLDDTVSYAASENDLHPLKSSNNSNVEHVISLAEKIKDNSLVIALSIFFLAILRE